MEVGVLDAKNRFSELVERAERGEEIVITRRGKPAAKLVAAAPQFDRAKARAAMERIRQIGDSMTGPPITLEEIIAWKNEGRR